MDELLALFELSDWKDELVESYSHGMRQKLIISSALLHRPEAIVVDEPMVGLDPRGARFLKDLFRAFVDRGGTVLMSTHTLEVAEAMCDRIGIIQQGKIVACGTMAELRAANRLGRHESRGAVPEAHRRNSRAGAGCHPRSVSTTKPAPVQPTLRTVLPPEVAGHLRAAQGAEVGRDRQGCAPGPARTRLLERGLRRVLSRAALHPLRTGNRHHPAPPNCSA